MEHDPINWAAHPYGPIVPTSANTFKMHILTLYIFRYPLTYCVIAQYDEISYGIF